VTDRARRRPVWAALAELFVDNEVRPDVAAAALACVRSGYADDELQRIWTHEVAPVLAPNLLSVAGEWVGFDLDWLAERIEQRRPTPLDRVPAWLARAEWQQVRRLTAWLRGWPTDRHDALAQAVAARIGAAVELTRPTPPLSPQEAEAARSVARDAVIALHVRGEDPPLAAMLAKLEPADP